MNLNQSELKMKMHVIEKDGQEYHHAVCDHCSKLFYPSHKNPYIFFGFMCLDTKMFISNDCKEDYYLKKNRGDYGNQHRFKFTEMPIQVPWKNEPKRLPIYQELYFDKKMPSQLLLFEI
jgi:hypothetical protein